MRITTRARVAFLIALATLAVTGIVGSQLATAGSQEDGGGSVPAVHPGDDPVAAICAAPEDGEAPVDCDDMVSGICAAPEPGATAQSDRDDMIQGSGGDRGEQVTGSGPDAVVSYTPCPGDDSKVQDPDEGAQLVEPTPGMADVRSHIFDHAVVGDDGTTVTVLFWSGVEPCYVLDHVDVRYDAKAVTITLYEGHDASAGDVACIEIALLKKVVVELDEPLGGREIVDGAA